MGRLDGKVAARPRRYAYRQAGLRRAVPTRRHRRSCRRLRDRKALPTTIDAVSNIIGALCAFSVQRADAKCGRAHRLLRAAQCGGQARHGRAGILWPRRLYAPHRHAGSVTPISQGGDPLAARRRSGRDLQGRAILFRAARDTHLVSANASIDRAGRADRGCCVADEGAHSRRSSNSIA